MAVRSFNHVGYMIAVAMRNEYEIGRDFFRVDLPGEWIWGDERIEEERFSARLDRKTGVPIISKFHRITYGSIAAGATVCTGRNQLGKNPPGRRRQRKKLARGSRSLGGERLREGPTRFRFRP